MIFVVDLLVENHLRIYHTAMLLITSLSSLRFYQQLNPAVSVQNNLSEESIDRVTRGVKHMGSSLAMTEKAGNLTIEEEDEVRAHLKEIKDADKKEQAKARALDGKIEVLFLR